MSVDNVIKVWDLRTNKCTQTITHDEWPQSEDAQPLSMVYDTGRKRLITASRRPFMWEHKLIMKDRTGHRSACVKAVYNSTFFVVVSVDDSAPPILHVCQLCLIRKLLRLYHTAGATAGDNVFTCLELTGHGTCCAFMKLTANHLCVEPP